MPSKHAEAKRDKQQNIVAMNEAQFQQKWRQQQQQQRVAIQCQSHISIMFYKWLQTDWRRSHYPLAPGFLLVYILFCA